jgi:hypothetical protein
MKRKYYLIVLLWITACYSCKKSNRVIEQPVHVYVAGYEFKDGNVFAKYWKDGKPVPLREGSNKGRVESIIVSGGDVYMAGYEDIVANTKAVAKYWKNGRSVALSDSLNANYASSIAVSGSDVYVSGSQSTGTTSSSLTIAKYWKNGIPVILSDGLHSAGASSIAVSSSDVYVAGSESTGKKDRDGFDLVVAKYWKNGASVILSQPAIFTGAQSIVVAGNDIYVSGNVYTAATYWKNGTSFTLSNNSIGASGSSIAVSGTDVYVAGFENNGTRVLNAKYWKNGTAVNITNGPYPAIANSIAVSGNDVYVAGYEGIGVNQSYLNGLGIAKYWKNGSPVALSDSINHSIATSIFLSRE